MSPALQNILHTYTLTNIIKIFNYECIFFVYHNFEDTLTFIISCIISKLLTYMNVKSTV
jgi:hypothetical protein